MTSKQTIATLEKAERLLRKARAVPGVDQASHIGGLENMIGNAWRLTKQALETERKRQADIARDQKLQYDKWAAERAAAE